MGIDFLDLNFRLEKHFRVKLTPVDLEKLAGNRKPFDLRAGELLACIQAKRARILPECPNCGYDLTGNTSGVCPECGLPFSEWEALRTILATVGGIERETITPESLIIKDLGFT